MAEINGHTREPSQRNIMYQVDYKEGEEMRVYFIKLPGFIRNMLLNDKAGTEKSS